MALSLVDLAVAMASGISQEEAQRRREAREAEEAEAKEKKAEQQEDGQSNFSLKEIEKQLNEDMQIMDVLEQKGYENPEVLVHSGLVKSVEEARAFSVNPEMVRFTPGPDYVDVIRFSASCVDSDKCFVEQPDGYYHRKGWTRLKEEHMKYATDESLPTYVFLVCNGMNLSQCVNTDDLLNNLDSTFFSCYRFANYALKLVATRMRIPKREILEFGFANYESQYAYLKDNYGITKEMLTLDNYGDIYDQYYGDLWPLDDLEALIPCIKKEWILGEFGVEFDRNENEWVCTGRIQ